MHSTLCRWGGCLQPAVCCLRLDHTHKLACNIWNRDHLEPAFCCLRLDHPLLPLGRGVAESGRFCVTVGVFFGGLVSLRFADIKQVHLGKRGSATMITGHTNNHQSFNHDHSPPQQSSEFHRNLFLHRGSIDFFAQNCDRERLAVVTNHGHRERLAVDRERLAVETKVF